MVMQGRIASSETNIRLLTTTTQVRREQLEVRRARLVMLELVMYAANSGYDLRKPVMVPAACHRTYGDGNSKSSQGSLGVIGSWLRGNVLNVMKCATRSRRKVPEKAYARYNLRKRRCFCFHCY